MIVTAKLDRMFRSAADALATLEELKDHGIGLHMIDLGGDVCGNGIGKLVFTILAAVAENERDRIRERIRDVKRNLASQGIFGGGKRPFGYNVVENKKPNGEVEKRLVPNATEQAALARMKRLRSRKISLRKIAKTVAEEFELPVLSAKSVQRILGNPNRGKF